MKPDFGHWLAGFVDGEGCFFIYRNSHGARACGFRLALHHDDEPILREIAAQTGLGTVRVGHPASQASPRAMWTVQRKAECLALVELFERFPLRAKKRRDFDIWARAVREHQRLSMRGKDAMHGDKFDYSVMDQLRHELWAGRPNRGPEPVVGVAA